MTNKIFPITPASALADLSILGILLIMLVAFIALSICCYQHFNPFSRIVFIELFFIVLILAVSFLFIYFGYSARNTKFIITDEDLKIKGALYGRTIDKNSLVTQE